MNERPFTTAQQRLAGRGREGFAAGNAGALRPPTEGRVRKEVRPNDPDPRPMGGQ